jgi:hypothetical protein
MNEFAATKESQTDIPKISDPQLAATEKVISAGRDVQNAAVDLANASAEALKGHASELIDAAKDIASDAGNRLQEKVTEQKVVGADYVTNLADAMRRAAGEFDNDVPIAGDYIRKAATQVASAASALKSGNLSDLVQGAQSFAKNQPTAFLGLAVLAGFGVVRFLKSSPGRNESSERSFAPMISTRLLSEP